MNSYIKSIILFNISGEKRFIKFTNGLNIITGQSKSGKSALLEIIDYCFGSNNSTIPKGKITDFTYLYSIVLKVNNEDLIIGRRNFNYDGRRSMFLKVESPEIDIEKITLEYFTENYFIQKSRVIREIENLLGLTITDTTTDIDSRKEGRPSIRNMMSFLLQHQNLVASKFALFYRFDDSRKREKVINQFPVFSGWVDQQYYTYKYQLDLLLNNFKRMEKENISKKKYLEQKKEQLFQTFNNYYMLIGEKLDKDISIQELILLRNNLPNINERGYFSTDLKQKYKEAIAILEEKRRLKHKYELILSNLENSEHYGTEYIQNLSKLRDKSSFSNPQINSYVCPLCGNEHTSVNEEINQVLNSINWLQKEISEVQLYKNSYGEEINNYQLKIKEIESEIRTQLAKVDELERINQEIQNGKILSEQVIYAKAKIDLEIDLISNTFTFLNEQDIDDLKNNINELKEKIAGYVLDNYYAEAKTYINKHMNNIVSKLDFEEEFQPPKLVFELEDTFDLYHNDKNNKSRIYLSEMGSGANWLSCHIGLFMSLLRYFCSQENSSIPKFLFFDQPSQVYFPDTSGPISDNNQNEKDIKAVKMIYKALLDEIEDIYNETGIRPQVIVTDHVTNLELEGYDFNSFITESWFDKKLI
ncbi:DUF3732 domain-containing protein [Bacillus sp. FJAT-29814]|uniref:DUF3732 domain-containing protein n=1 Tax=Bacillus sp. FJAT-29814 TaxID=1729688 RepID=UPI00083656C3|nr:DUF3732 domain-containing protein [Bacillus sp. FJAT-29814]